MKIKQLISLSLFCLLFFIGIFAGKFLETMGVIDPANDPGTTSSYSLEDIYSRLVDGTAGSQTTFTEPSSGPGTSSMHDINEIMGKAPAVVTSSGAVASSVLSGKKFWGLTSGEWGLQTGAMTNNGTKFVTPGTSKQYISQGYHSGYGYVNGDADLIAGNIKSGVDLFGIDGTYKGPERFVDNGDNTITDLKTNLMWTKVIPTTPDNKNWQDAYDYCSSLSYAGYSDWRLPEVYELSLLLDKKNNHPALPDDHPFTGEVNSYFWSRTGYIDSEYSKTQDCAWCVYIYTGEVSNDNKLGSYDVWAVRSL